MEFHVPVAVHVSHGGFGLTPVMHERLLERDVSWLARCGRASDGRRWYLPSDGDELRRDPDLVEVVRQLEHELEERTAGVESWAERADIERRLLDGVRVARVRIVIEVEDDDGRETIRVTGGTW